MAQDPAFLFYPGDYLRDTQCLSENTQVAYDRIMCEHMRNICISQQQLDFFTKKLSDAEKTELAAVLTKTDQGYQISWVAQSICKRKNYSASRRQNRAGKKKDVNNISESYVSHMENENENVIENENGKERGVGEENPPPAGSAAAPEIIPVVIEMETIWREVKPNYPQVRGSTDDKTGLFAIGDFVAQQLGMPWLPHFPQQRVRIMAAWRAMANWIAQDEFYSPLALLTLSSVKTMQTIWQKHKQTKNGTNSGKVREIALVKPVATVVPSGGFGFNSGR